MTNRLESYTLQREADNRFAPLQPISRTSDATRHHRFIRRIERLG